MEYRRHLGFDHEMNPENSGAGLLRIFG